MNCLVKVKNLLSVGTITKAEKVELETEFKALEAKEQEAVKEEYEKALALDISETNENELVKEMKDLMGTAVKEMGEDIRTDLKKQLDENARLMKNSVGAYNPEIQAQEKRKSLNAKLRAVSLAALGNDAKLKEMTTDAESTPFAGYTVDSELSAEIRHLITEYGVARRESLTIQLTKNSYKANNLATDLTVFWVDEGAVIRSSEVVLGQETLELKKLGVIAGLTTELLEDEEIDLFSFIAGRVAEGFAQAEDEAYFIGDGTSTYGSFTGLLINANVNEVTMAGTTFASITADDLINMADATPQGALANSKYYMHRTIMSFVRKLKDDNGQYIYQAPSAQGPATIWGYPVLLVEAMPAKTATAADTSFVLFGDLKKATIFGYKGAIKAKRFDAGTIKNVANDDDINLITTDREAIRFTERFGFIVIIPTAVTKLTTAAASA